MYQEDESWGSIHRREVAEYTVELYSHLFTLDSIHSMLKQLFQAE